MVLVTGGTGLVGSHLLLRLLENGDAVRALYRSESSKKQTQSLFAIYNQQQLFDKIEWTLGDINDIPSLERAFKNIKYVYHCAALISFDPNDEERLRKTNIEGTANIVNFCLEYKIRKLCHVSSVAALGDLKHHETIITEETEWNPEKPHSDYAISKYGAEMEIWRGQQEGLETVVINPGIILAAGFPEKGSGQIFSYVRQGLKYFTKGITAYVAVEDVVSIMITLMKSDIHSQRFIVVAENLSFENVLKLISREMNTRPPFIYASPFMTAIAWRLDWLASELLGRKRELSKDAARSLHSVSRFSNAEIVKTIGWKFKDIDVAIKEIVVLQL